MTFFRHAFGCMSLLGRWVAVHSLEGYLQVKRRGQGQVDVFVQGKLEMFGVKPSQFGIPLPLCVLFFFLSHHQPHLSQGIIRDEIDAAAKRAQAGQNWQNGVCTPGHGECAAKG